MAIWLSCTESTKVLTPNAFRRSLGVNSLSFTQRTTPESLVCNFSFWLFVSFCFIFFPFVDLGTEPRTLPTQGKCAITELPAKPLSEASSPKIQAS